MLIQLVQSLAFGLAIVCLVVGLVGILVPLLPGMLLIWLSVLAYAIVDGFQVVTPAYFALLTLLALATGSADWWLPMLGAKVTGASPRAMRYGLAGGIIGFLIAGPLPGAVLGYALGVLWAEYQRQQDWGLALKASLGGLAGFGIATLLQLAGGLLIIALFLIRTLGG